MDTPRTFPCLQEAPKECFPSPLLHLGKGAYLVAQMVKNPPAMQETWVQSLRQEDALEEGMEPTPLFLPGEFHGLRSLVGYGPLGFKESDTTE